VTHCWGQLWRRWRSRYWNSKWNPNKMGDDSITVIFTLCFL
jgi:hypothetical protein